MCECGKCMYAGDEADSVTAVKCKVPKVRHSLKLFASSVIWILDQNACFYCKPAVLLCLHLCVEHSFNISGENEIGHEGS